MKLACILTCVTGLNEQFCAMLPLYSSSEHTAQVALLVGTCAFIVAELHDFGYSTYTASEAYCATPSHPALLKPSSHVTV